MKLKGCVGGLGSGGGYSGFEGLFEVSVCPAGNNKKEGQGLLAHKYGGDGDKIGSVDAQEGECKGVFDGVLGDFHAAPEEAKHHDKENGPQQKECAEAMLEREEEVIVVDRGHAFDFGPGVFAPADPHVFKGDIEVFVDEFFSISGCFLGFGEGGISTYRCPRPQADGCRYADEDKPHQDEDDHFFAVGGSANGGERSSNDAAHPGAAA